MRDERYKLIRYHTPGGGQLFDLQTDPKETTNLWDRPDHLRTRLHLTEALSNWQHEQELRYLGGRGGHSIPLWWNPS